MKKKNLAIAADITTQTESSNSKRQYPEHRAAQSRRIARNVTAYREILTNAQTDPELVTLLDGAGFDRASLVHGLELIETVAGMYDIRQMAMGTDDSARGARRTSVESVRQNYVDFRAMVRSLFKTSAARTALGLTERRPYRRDQLVTHARAAYKAALGTPEYLTKLTKFKYDANRLQELLDELDALYTSVATANDSYSSAVHVTQTRNQAVTAMEDYMLSFRTVARRIARRRPDLRARLIR
jgi:hypothetical protein